MALKRVKAEINADDQITGVKTISLVDEPAIESDFVFFSKEKPTFIELKSDKLKQVVLGAVLIPEKDILRYDENKEPFNMYFTSEEIEKTRDKFFDQELQNLVNTDHDSKKYVDATIRESYIIQSEEQLKHVQNLGIKDATIGTWMISYHIKEKEVFERVVKGELNGFSVEIFLNRLTRQSNNSISKQGLMKDLKDLFEGFKKEFKELQKQIQKFETAKSEDGKVTYSYGEAGEAVNVISADAEGKEVSEPAKDGEYKLDNKKTIVVKDGKLESIKDSEEAPAEAAKEEVKKDEKLTSIYANYQLKDGKQANVNVASVNEVYIYDGDKSELAATGEYELKEGGFIVVEDGKFIAVKDAPESKAFDEKKELAKAKANVVKLQKELDAFNVEKENFKKEVDQLKVEVQKLKKLPIGNPIVKTEEKKLEKNDLAKLSNADRFRLEMSK